MKNIAQSPFSAALLAIGLGLFPLSQGLAQTAEAQSNAEAGAETSQDNPAEELGLSMGEPVDEDGNRLNEEYILEVHTDWAIVCIRTQLSDDPCSMRQVLRDTEENAISTVDIVSFPPGNQVVAAGRIVVPLETLLTQQATLSVDGGAGRRYPFDFCTQQGCISRVGFAQGDINAFRAGNVATLTIVPALAPDQRVRAEMSLSGFTAGWERLTELTRANEAAIEKLRAEQGN